MDLPKSFLGLVVRTVQLSNQRPGSSSGGWGSGQNSELVQAGESDQRFLLKVKVVGDLLAVFDLLPFVIGQAPRERTWAVGTVRPWERESTLPLTVALVWAH
jgi:hypothetical protein